MEVAAKSNELMLAEHNDVGRDPLKEVCCNNSVVSDEATLRLDGKVPFIAFECMSREDKRERWAKVEGIVPCKLFTARDR